MGTGIVVVTGASGFIGAHIVQVLLERGYTVHACVRNKDDKKNAFLTDMAARINIGKLLLFSAELLVDGAYDAAAAGAESMIHAAAVLAIAGSQDPQKDMVEPSTQGTMNVLGSVEKQGVKHYVHTSSVAAVANTHKNATFDETDWSDVPIDMSPYNYAKTEGEKVVWRATEGKAYTVSCINPTMVFGACLSKPHAKASPYVFRQALYGNAYPNTPMSVVDVRDVATAHVEAMERPEADRKRFILDNDDDNTTANDVVRAAQRLFPQHEWTLQPEFEGGFLKRQWDNSLSKSVLGIAYAPSEQTIRASVASMVDPGWVPVRPTGAASKL